MNSPPNKPFNHAQRLLIKIHREDACILTECHNVSDPSSPKSAPASIIDKDSLNEINAASNANKYSVDNKAMRVLGLAPK